MVKNMINNKVYIGQTTVGFRNRYKIRKNDLLNYGYYKYQKSTDRKHCNEHILSAMEKYGWQNFEVIEQIDIVYKHKYSQDELDCRECYWISYYNSFNKKYGYNNAIGGKGTGRINTQCISVVLLNEERIFPSLALASEYVNIKSYDSISDCCEGKQRYAGKINNEFAVWCYYDEYTSLTKEEIKRRLDKSNDTRKNKTKRKVLCVNDDLKFNSLRKCASYYGVNHGRISECCKGDRDFILINDKEYYFTYIEG